mgnify:CR=1 FL=1
MAKEKIHLVNDEKVRRAKDILDLLQREGKDDGEREQKNKFAALLSSANLDPKSEEALRFVYEKLGGLMRTEAEQQAAEEKKAAIKEKGRRRKVE